MKLMVINITLSVNEDLNDAKLTELCDKLGSMDLGERLKGAAEFLLSNEPKMLQQVVVTVQE